MTGVGLLALGRLGLTFLITFIVLPLLAEPRTLGNRVDRAIAGFVRLCLVLMVGIMLLGYVKLALPGAVTVFYAAHLAAWVLWTRRLRWLRGSARWRAAVARILERVEQGTRVSAGRTIHEAGTRWRVPTLGLLVCLLALAILFQRAGYGLFNLRFAKLESYSRALSLQTLTHGQPWQPDASVTLLAPLAYWSGLDVDWVIRLSGPILFTVLALAVGYLAYRLSGRGAAGYLACGFAGILTAIMGDQIAGEISRGELAAVFWVLAASVPGNSWLLAAGCVAAALTIDLRLHPVLAGSLGCVLAGVALSKLAAWALRRAAVRQAAGALVVVAMTLAICAQIDSEAPDGPFQYEAAARTAAEISRQFHRNEWLIVSPVHELPITFGKGWHVELLDFAAGYSPAELSQRDFAFPYPVRDVFFFIEKVPMQPTAREGEWQESVRAGLVQSTDRAVIGYHSSAGRASLEFQAAALIAAYTKTHDNLRIFHEDDQLAVYWLSREPRPAAPLTGKAPDRR